MRRHQHLLIVVITAVCFCLTIPETVLSGADENQSVTQIGFGAVKAGALGSSVTDPSNNGINTSSVNLYTGQHQESFPLVSVAGRGGMGYSLSIDYNGISYRQATKENRKGQASDFGLGFSVGIQSIIVDHKGTLDYEDDEYRLLSGSSIVKLVKKSGNAYVTETGELWKITSTIDTVYDRAVVVGWTIIREDGTVYSYGDFSVVYNATRQMLRYGDFVGNGITNTDSLFPYQWDLKEVHDAENLNWVHLEYELDLRRTQVRSISTGSLVNSTFYYTSASHLKQLITSDGTKTILFYSGRNDNDLYWGYNNQEFVFAKKCDSLITWAHDSTVLSRLAFEYSYLNSSVNPSWGAPYEKLMLRKIIRWDSSRSASLPPLRFQYDSISTSPTYGAMIRITYPLGGVKALGYKALAESNNFAKLDVEVIDSSSSKPLAWSADNFFVVHKNSSSSEWIMGAWDGYWKLTSITASTADDQPCVSSEGWIAVPASASDSTIWVYRWKGGYWLIDTISNGPVRHDSAQLIHLFVGDDCILAANALGSVTDDKSTQAKYLRWNGHNWKSRLVFSDQPRIFRGYRLTNNLFALHTSRQFGRGFPWGFDSTLSYIDYGRYDYGLDSSLLGSRYSARGFGALSEKLLPGVVGGHQFVAWYGQDSLQWRRWNGSDWTSGAYVPGGTNYYRAITELPNGFVLNHSTANGGYSTLETAVPSGLGGFDRLDTLFWGSTANDLQLGYLSGGNNTLGGFFEHYWDTHLWSWNGISWKYQYSIADVDPNFQFDLRNYGSSWIYGPQRNAIAYGLQILYRPFVGVGAPENERWPGPNSVSLNSDQKDGFAAGPEFFLCRSNHQNRIYYYDLFHGTTWNPLVISQDTSFGGYSPFSCFYANKGTFQTWNCNYMQRCCGNPPYAYSDPRYWYSTYCLYDSVFRGDAPVQVVDSVVMYRFASDTVPTIQKYKYFGGLLDASATTPRFARTEVSTPYYKGATPEGYEAHCFYNDINKTGFWNDSVYALMSFPDLDSAAFGWPHGGYRLDGTEYLTYSYTVGDGAGKKNDSSRTYHSIHKTIDSLPDVFATRVDSVHGRSDSLSQDIYYRYGDSTGQLTSTLTRHIDGSHSYIDSMIYAYHANSQLLTDNAVSLVSDRIRIYDTTSGCRTLAHTRSSFVKKGGWRTAKANTWRNLDSLTGAVYTDTLFSNGRSLDAYGNVIASLNARGDTSCVKLDQFGIRPIATAANAAPWDFLAQDFEQPTGWDGWNLNLVSGSVVWVYTPVFTGLRAQKLKRPTGPNVSVLGASRVIRVDSLSDTLYNLSYWAKANHRAYIRIQSFGNSGNVIDSSISEYLPTDSSWTRVSKLMKIRRSYGGCNVDSIKIQLVADTVVFDTSYAYFDNLMFYRLGATVSATAYSNGGSTVSATWGVDDVPTYSDYDSFLRPVGGRNHRNQIMRRSTFFLPTSDTSTAIPYTVDSVALPTSGYRVAVTYLDGLGRPLQTRTRDSVGGSERAVVSGLATYDGRGRVVKSYKPYQDLLGSSGLFNYSVWDSAMAEVAAYYDADGPGPNCQGYPYSENRYATSVGGKLVEEASPGLLGHIGGGHTSTYQNATDTARKVYYSAAAYSDKPTERDSIDHWGRWSKSLDTLTLNGTLITVSMKSWKNVKGQVDSVSIDSSGGARIVLRRSWYNDLGQEDSTWKIDYGKIRMKYDRTGNLRFMQNDLRRSENKFVYFKYDALGRKTEEGLMGSATTYFGNQDSADSRSFPKNISGQSIAYRWYFDMYVVDTNTTLLAPGKLVRVADGLSTYYRHFKYSPLTFSDSTFVKLPNLDTLKRIVHDYNRDGSLSKLTISPKYPSVAGKRVYYYYYDGLGRPKSVMAPTEEGEQYSYAQYDYNPDGSVSHKRIGVFYDFDPPPIVNDTLQVVNYTYDPQGRLLAQNIIGSVDASLTGYGGAHDHFAQKLTYIDSSQSQYDGRLWKSRTAHSIGSGVSDYDWQYIYDGMGQLTFANMLGDSVHDEKYGYDWLGRRIWSKRFAANGADTTTTYQYDTTIVGSSKLIRYYEGTTPPNQFLRYDVLGNLLSDSARNITGMSWDYRNLMLQARMPSIAGWVYNSVNCAYDEAGNRLKKSYTTYAWGTCEEPPMAPEGAFGDSLYADGLSMQVDTSGGAEAMGGPGQQCPIPSSTHTYYLYDDGNLVATFDGTGNEIDMYVVMPSGGQIATYSQNNSSYLHYLMSDHLGSPRVMMNGVAKQVSAYYNYTPFGKTIEAYQSYTSPLQWTNHEHDQNGSFDYYNFGSRLYDPRVGLFLTPDKAGQFGNGYVYGGNSPVMGIDKDGNFFGLLLPIIDAAIKGMAYSLVSSGVVATATGHLDDWNPEGALVSGAMGGALTGALGGLSHVTSEAISQGAAPGSLRGVAASAVGSAITAAGATAATGGSIKQALRSFAVGGATGVLGATGGFGLAKTGTIGRFGYQAMTSAARSVGNNWVYDRNLIRNFDFGIGPVDVSIRDYGSFLSFNKIEAATMALGVGNWLGGVVYNSFAKKNIDNGLRVNWSNLSMEFSGGPIESVLYGMLGIEGFGGHTTWFSGPFDEVSDGTLAEERSHLWQTRAMGLNYYGSYLYNWMVNMDMYENPKDQYRHIHWENQAKNGGFYY